mmetsp:Transcript_34900/g.51910  ORF Transcript_34900/g.51910 Transcript_34900/m.51910 type:complete len:315 (-) Transcript_34900:230-1174(-)|eukprot:CAMPEP_0194047700 /NCGR_PEP_ID=MMETSP0009_2-20130614/25196_1 /TAXON_ID=210454 /ORGANISM="Grammatophora oceanica, Strain CCMP 410" /LENGTH=314 /DNA_ID=CAMNT_0038693383 /DNA_START=223 /DNA_END=1167 /DNA_ORIENTATION=+
MSTTEEATINPDGSTTFESSEQPSPVPDADDADFGDEIPDMDEETLKGAAAAQGGIDPIWLVLVGAIIGLLVLYAIYLWRKKSEETDIFFTELDGDKFNLKLPDAVEEYYEIKTKVEATGTWKPGQPSPKGPNGAPAQSGPQRVLAQALMKRAIADIPIVLFIQKESPGMNKLYSQSMCSVRQWKAYQGAEALVSSEVDEVRAEADEIEPGWSEVIWKQAMQYHQMLKQKHEEEAKKAAAVAAKRKEIEAKVAAEKAKPSPEEQERLKIAAAEKAAQELIKAEEREKASKTAFSSSAGSSGLKKGFLKSGGKKK